MESRQHGKKYQIGAVHVQAVVLRSAYARHTRGPAIEENVPRVGPNPDVSSLVEPQDHPTNDRHSAGQTLPQRARSQERRSASAKAPGELVYRKAMSGSDCDSTSAHRSTEIR